MNAEPEFCPAKLARDARIAELEAEAACYEGTTANQWRNAARAAQARIAELEAELDRAVEISQQLQHARRCLAAVIEVLDGEHGDIQDMTAWDLHREVRAAATGDPK